MNKKETIRLLKDKLIGIAIVGSRNFNDYDSLVKFIKEKIHLKEIKYVISGGARGADKLAEQFAYHYSFDIRVVYPNWRKYGRSAGFLRNKIIIENADVVFAFWDGESRGTLSSINLAKNLDKKLYVYNF